MGDGGSTVEGRAHLADGSPVVEARVFIASGPVPTSDVAMLTDEDGRFMLRAPVPGSYEIACHADGLAPALVRFEAPGDKDVVEIDFEMAPSR